MLRCIRLISRKAALSPHCHQTSGVNNTPGEADSCKVVISLRNPWVFMTTPRLTNLQAAYELEKYKARISSYPEMFAIIGKLSHKAKIPVTSEKAKEIAEELNDWFYSAGGMCAEPSTRGALLKLRDACIYWNKRGVKPDDLYKWRNYSLLLLRNDLGIKGLESFDYHKMASLIERVKEEVNQATKDDLLI
jgi:hypothetical protein